MFRKVLLGLLFWSSTLYSYGQLDGPRHPHLSYQIGYGHLLIHDQLSSPLTYSAHALHLGIQYDKKERYYLEWGAQLQVGSSQPLGIGKRRGSLTDVPDFYGQAETYEFVLNPFFSLLQTQGHMRLGTSLGNSRHVLGVGIKARHIHSGMRLDTWAYTQADLAPFYAARFSMGNGELEALIEMPLLVGVVRPNYSSDAYIPGYTSYYLTYLKTEARLTTISQLQQPQLRLMYTFPRSNSTTYGIGYQGSWTYYPRPELVSMLSNQIFFQFQF